MKVLEFLKTLDGKFSLSRLINLIGCLVAGYAMLHNSFTWPSCIAFIAFLAYSLGAHVFGKFLASAADAAKKT